MAKKKRATKKRTTKAKTRRKAAAKKSVNKAQAIRDYAQKNPSAGPTAVSRALATKGIQVTAGQVSTTLSNAKKNGKKKPPAAKAKKRAQKPVVSESVSVTDLMATMKFVRDVGDVANARQLIDVVSKLQQS